jgi:hypothetical protein
MKLICLWMILLSFTFWGCGKKDEEISRLKEKEAEVASLKKEILSLERQLKNFTIIRGTIYENTNT